MKTNLPHNTVCSAKQAEKTQQIKGIIRLLFISSTILGILLRIFTANNGMFEYDEIWTVQHYAGLSFLQIFDELAVPNNHPLNSIAIKLTYTFFHPEQSPILFRISSLLSGFLLIVAVFTACVLYAKRHPSISGETLFAFTLFPTLFSPGLVHYSAVLRGYAMQSFFFFVTYISLLFLLTETDLTKKERNRSAIIGIVSALLTAFTITSGVIFCFAAAVAFLLLSIRSNGSIRSIYKKFSVLLNGGILAGTIVAIWLGCHINDIHNAQTFGNSVHSPILLSKFILETLTETGTLPFFLLIIASAFFLHKKNDADSTFTKVSLFTLLFLLITICSALFSGAGPVRVYLPICAPIFFSCGLVLAYATRKMSFKFSSMICLAVFLYSIAWYQFRITDEIPENVCLTFLNESSKLPDSTLAIYPTGSGYEIQFNLNSETIQKETRRHFRKDTDTLALLKGHQLTALDHQYGESAIKLSSAPAHSDATFDYYPLKKITELTDLSGKTIFAKIQPISRENMSEINLKLKDAGFLLLNPFLDSSFSTQEDPVPGAFYATDSYPYTLQDILNFTEDYAPFVQFYLLH